MAGQARAARRGGQVVGRSWGWGSGGALQVFNGAEGEASTRRPAGCHSTCRSLEGSRRGLGPPGRMAESEPRSPARFGAEERQAASESRDGSEARLRLATVRRALLLALRPHPTDGDAGLGPLGYDSDSEIRARPGSATDPAPRDQGRPPPSGSIAPRTQRHPSGPAAQAIRAEADRDLAGAGRPLANRRLRRLDLHPSGGEARRRRRRYPPASRSRASGHGRAGRRSIAAGSICTRPATGRGAAAVSHGRRRRSLRLPVALTSEPWSRGLASLTRRESLEFQNRSSLSSSESP